MVGEKKKSVTKIVERLRAVLAEGNLGTQLKEQNGDVEALTEREYTLYQEILSSWYAQLEELEE